MFSPNAALAQHPDFPELDSLPVLDSVPAYEMAALARRLVDQTDQIREVFVRKAQRATLEREVVADQLAASEADTLAPPEEREILKKALKTTKEAEKIALADVAKAEKVLASVQKLPDQESEALRKSLPKAHKQVAALIPKPEPVEAPIAEVIGVPAVSDPANPPAAGAQDSLAVVAEQPPAPPKPAPRPQFKKYDPAGDVMLNPPARACALVVDTRDEFSGERRREAQKEELFRFTNPSLKAYLQDRDHVVCQASVAVKGSTYLLNLQFQINDANAKRAFGSLPKNGVAILKLLDGETLTLYNLRADEGVAGSDKVSYTFAGQYAIDPGMLKKLQKSLLDKVRIAWSTGYEDYETYNVDLLSRQLGCLLK
ncbi:MAG: hypothetical protein JNJ90_01490 [Saprospiraceae bacterium]|nr:hypothetical protein [Saprospiraceae bacterium]